jgi:hypothetical protein
MPRPSLTRPLSYGRTGRAPSLQAQARLLPTPNSTPAPPRQLQRQLDWDAAGLAKQEHTVARNEPPAGGIIHHRDTEAPRENGGWPRSAVSCL